MFRKNRYFLGFFEKNAREASFWGVKIFAKNREKLRPKIPKIDARSKLFTRKMRKNTEKSLFSEKSLFLGFFWEFFVKPFFILKIFLEFLDFPKNGQKSAKNPKNTKNRSKIDARSKLFTMQNAKKYRKITFPKNHFFWGFFGNFFVKPFFILKIFLEFLNFPKNGQKSAKKWPKKSRKFQNYKCK